MTRFLITGGAGFIGSHLAEALLARGDQVTIIDDLSTGRFENVEPLVDRPGFERRLRRAYRRHATLALPGVDGGASGENGLAAVALTRSSGGIRDGAKVGGN